MNEGPMFIAAGTGKDSRYIEGLGKPFLEIDGKKNIEIIVDEATKTNNERPIYVWGSENELKQILSPIIKREREKREVVVVPCEGDIIENLFLAYLAYLNNKDPSFKDDTSKWTSFSSIDWKVLKEYAKEKNILQNKVDLFTCDIPLITHEEMDFFMNNQNPNVDVSNGWSLKDSFDEVIESLNKHNIFFDYEKSKMNFFSFLNKNQGRKKIIESRFNNSYGGKPLNVSLTILNFIPKIYRLRHLVNKNSPNTKNLLNIFKEFVHDFTKEIDGKKINKLQLSMYLTSLITSGLTVHISHYIKDQDKLKKLIGYHNMDMMTIERNARNLTGNEMHFYVTNLIGPLFDIDKPYEYYFIRDNFLKIRNEIDKYYSDNGMHVIHN